MAIILIIEDNRRVQDFYRELLGEEYEVLQAYNGREGLEKATNCKPDLLILDLAVPEIDGRSLLGAIKKVNKTLPIVIVSGRSGMQDDPEIELNSQVRRFFVKPIDLDELCDAIHTILAKKPILPCDTGGITKIGGCVLEHMVGEGTSGTVYKGTRLGVNVAVKILSQEAVSDVTKVARFQREAQILSQIKHPAIIQLLDMGHTSEGIYFMVMEYFPGQSLSVILENVQKISCAEAIEIVLQVADGMELAHGHGLVHRDLKPSNILYDRSRHSVKIIDFGLARKIDCAQNLTQEGYLLGTPLYMSPEQCRGIEVDHRSDIYNLGVMFYEMLTGIAVFERAQLVQIFWAHIYDPVEWPEEVSSGISPSLRRMIEKMLAKEPQDRYQSMKEIVRDLQREKIQTKRNENGFSL